MSEIQGCQELLDENSREPKVILQSRVLLSKNERPYSPDQIKQEISNFGHGYNRTVMEIIHGSRNELTREVFLKNVAVLMSNFLMTRSGPFRGVRYNRREAKVVGEDKIGPCWKAAGKNMTELKEFISSRPESSYQRVLTDMKIGDQRKVADDLWEIFKLLLPPCMGKSTLGLVAASKILFSVFPEVALPVDNTQWRAVFKTVDYSDIIMHMAKEIARWEMKAGCQLNSCVPDCLEAMTLPAIYNVMAMKARSR